MNLLPARGNALLALLLAFLVAPGHFSKAADLSSLAPSELVRRTIANELRTDPHAAAFMFRDRKETPHGSETKLMVETKDAMVGLIIAFNDHPLTPEQRTAEDARVDRFVKDPEELEKRKRQEKDEAEHTVRIMKALPDAFLYEYDGTLPGAKGLGRSGSTLTRLKFHPNPDYNPPTRVEQVLMGMQGFLLIDPVENRIARIDGTLEKEVSFGWGILGHLDRGGHFLVEQADVGDGHWEISHMDLDFTGKILLFKAINIKSNEVQTDFQSVTPNLSFAQGLEMLRKQEALLAENGAITPQK